MKDEKLNIPKGFLFATAEASVKKPGRKDMALICSDTEAVMAGAFTTNRVKAAPVQICMRKIRSGIGRAIIVNSGNANACTGRQGLSNANEIVSIVSKGVGIKSSSAYICSTGVIGTPLPMERIVPALSGLTDDLGHSSFEEVARAIMTTDTFPKCVSRKVRIAGRTGTIAGLCKGAGMIAPNMATMLCFIITDVAVEQKTLSSVVKDSAAKTFNRITIDGDMSTNDTVLMMANGALGNEPVGAASPSLEAFRKAVEEVMYDLSELIVRDGEGATKLIEVIVKGARSQVDAERAAFSVANSNLVKTAVYGNDANWGRIMAALGYSGARFREDRTDISFGPVKVVRNGLSTKKDTEAAVVLKSKEVRITVDFHGGKSSAKVLTCDFTEAYVRINAEYRT
jgi:glutamate N-acetyltransferase/amino-acid N-acetyltransferase